MLSDMSWQEDFLFVWKALAMYIILAVDDIHAGQNQYIFTIEIYFLSMWINKSLYIIHYDLLIQIYDLKLKIQVYVSISCVVSHYFNES